MTYGYTLLRRYDRMARTLKAPKYWIEAADMGKLLDAVERHGRENVRFWFAPQGFSKDGPKPAWDVEAQGVTAQIHEEGHEGENFVWQCPPKCPNGG